MFVYWSDSTHVTVLYRYAVINLEFGMSITL